VTAQDEHPPIPAFGERRPGQAYVTRPGAYAIIVDRAGRTLLVRVDGRYFLPGGGAEPGETAEATVRREILEECGLNVDVLERLGVVDQYLYAADEDTHFHKRCTVFVTTLASTDPRPVEAGCEIVWLAPDEAERRLAHESQVWAVRRYRQGRSPSCHWRS
jgi:8-oxo-dGTP diphosphatase